MNVCGCGDRWKPALFGLLSLARLPKMRACVSTQTHARGQTRTPRWAGQTRVLSLEKISASIHSRVGLSVPATPP